jgi:predicted nucleotidyltransferase
MLPGVARKTEEAESKGVWGHPKEEVTQMQTKAAAVNGVSISLVTA